MNFLMNNGRPVLILFGTDQCMTWTPCEAHGFHVKKIPISDLKGALTLPSEEEMRMLLEHHAQAVTGVS